MSGIKSEGGFIGSLKHGVIEGFNRGREEAVSKKLKSEALVYNFALILLMSLLTFFDNHNWYWFGLSIFLSPRFR